MKLTVVGGGSTYSPELASGLGLRAERLDLRTLTLMDADPTRLEIVGGFVQRMLQKAAPQVRVMLESALTPVV